MNLFTIRRAIADDLQSCTTLFMNVFNQEPWNDEWSRENAELYLQDYLDSPGFKGVVAEDDSGILGFIFGIRKRWWLGEELMIHEMCVNTESQRGGIGTALMTGLASEASIEGIVRFTLLTDRGVPAEAFYKKNGFEQIERLIFMSKELGSSN